LFWTAAFVRIAELRHVLGYTRPPDIDAATDHGIRLDDRQRAANIGEQPIEADQYQSVDAAEEKALTLSD